MTLHGVMAEFGSVGALIDAIERVRKEGYRKIDAYTPFPSHDVIHALHLPPSRLPWIVLAGGIFGALFGYGLQYWTNVIDYPLNIGGRPLHSWPYFVPVTFECIVLFAALSTVFGMLGMNRLPTPYHPVFNDPQFALASRDSFFLCVEATDPKFDRDALISLFTRLEAIHVAEIPD
jgi:ActD protein